MKIWLVNDGENLPIDGENPRLQRMGLLANCLTNLGVDVLWWQSTFDHYKKRFRYQECQDTAINDKLRLILIHSVGYNKNVCVRRLYHHYDEARQFYKKALNFEKPDVMVVCMLTIAFTHYATKYAKKNNIPIIVDVRDLNPDVYVSPFHGITKALVKIGIKPLQWCLSNSLKRASGLIGTTQPYLDWALAYAGRTQCDNDRVYFVSYQDKGLRTSLENRERWSKFKTSTRLTCCFFGQFGRLVDFDTIIATAALCKKNDTPVNFILCGSGEYLEKYKTIVNEKQLDNVFLPGWVNQDDIQDVGYISDLGLMSYYDDKNFNMQMTNKFSEYLSLGLGILLQPTGVMLDVIKKNSCGVHFKNAEELHIILNSFITNPENLKKMKSNARELFEKEFSAQKVYTEYGKFLMSNAKK